MSILLKSDGLLILRDGHPFGDIGSMGGYCKQWPLSQTLTGMIRTKIGFAKSANYFDDKKNCDEILQYGIKQQIPILENGDYLAPVPSDIVFSQEEFVEKRINDETKEEEEIKKTILTVNIPILKSVDDSYGTDIENKEWLIPYLELKDKPAKEKPFFLYWDIFIKYLQEDLNAESGELYKFGTSAPISETRMHNTIDPETLITKKGQLFSNKGIYLQVNTSKDDKAAVNLLVDIEDKSGEIDILGEAYLGGERKTVCLEKSDIEFPECPAFFENKKFLKLILASHGDFGNWCPDWLKPDLEDGLIEWVTIPNTEYKVRLRSAYVSGHDSVSGWDYITNKPKASKKLVLPGSVYVIELENSDDSQKVSELFWGNYLDIENEESSLSGYGQLFVGNIAYK